MKTKKISIPSDFTISRKSVDTTYAFKDNCYNRGVTLNFDIQDDYKTIYAKGGNNLYIMTQFGNGDDPTIIDTVLTVVKDYYSFCDTWQASTTVDKKTVYNDAKSTSYEYVSGDVSERPVVVSFIGDKSKTNYNLKRLESGKNVIYELGGSDYYEITPQLPDSGTMTITDYLGNDNYLVQGTDYDISDYSGNDRYSTSSNGTFKSYDFKGDDIYHVHYTEKATVRDDNGKDVYYISNISDTKDGAIVYEYGGADKYNLENIKKAYIQDSMGNDKYNLTKVTNLQVDDYKGKDTYNFEQVSGIINETTGNDKYNFTASTGVEINDDGGADKYTFKDSSKSISVYDHGGKDDKYTVSDSEDIYIVDNDASASGNSGNDTYKVTDSTEVAIEDVGGKDTYNMSVSTKVEIEDHAGKDTYNLNAVFGLSLLDESGDDKYNFDVVNNKDYKQDDYNITDKLGKDKYTVANSEKLMITDEDGNDTYKLKDSKNIRVSDKAGDDKYTLENLTTDDLSFISDIKGKDTYTIKSTTESSKVWVVDNDGADTYNITGGKTIGGLSVVWDLDKTSNDKYTIDKFSGITNISDAGGQDTLALSSTKSKNLIYMANFKNDNKGVSDGSLILIDKVKCGAAVISDYFKTQTSGETTMITSEKSAGCIETIKAKSTNVNSKIDAFATSTELAQLSSQVASWLSDSAHAYSSVNALFTNGTEAHIEDFILTFGQ